MRSAMRVEAARKAAEASASASSPSAGTSTHTADDADAAARRWDLTGDNAVTSDAYWAPDEEHMTAVRKRRPWKTDAQYFKSVCISATAAVKMLVHAKRGMPREGQDNWFEVMGLMMGHYKDDVLYVTDSFGLPVDASEVECSMNENSMVYQVEYLNYHRRVGKADKGCIGWYHSHPGYTCFLSGIDVNTQQLHQLTQDPWLAVVVDPVGTIASGRMDIKAFRTYTDETAEQMQQQQQQQQQKKNTTPSFDVIKKKGLHAHKYYELPITYVRSTTDAAQLDALLGQYWSQTFTTNPLVANHSHYTQRMMEVERALSATRTNDGDDGSQRYGNEREDQEGLETADETDGARRRTSSRTVSVYDQQWGPYRRAALTERSSEARNPSAVGGPPETNDTSAVGQCCDLATEMLLGAVQLSLKEGVFGGVPP